MTKKEIVAYATVCFPDEEREQWKVMRDLFDLLIKTEAMPSDIIIHLSIAEGNLHIELDKGFQFLSIPLRYIQEILNSEETKR